MHPAIRTVEQGRGWGVSTVPIIDLVRKKPKGTVWHVLREGFVVGTTVQETVCGTKPGPLPFIIRAVDPKVIFVEGHPVCSRCIAALGDIPMPALIKERA